MKALGAIVALMLAALAAQPLSMAQETTTPAQRFLGDIRQHLIGNRCWSDHSDMPDARRLRAIFRVWIGQDGKFSRVPEMVYPTAAPVADAPMSEFVVLVLNALATCNELGWPVPENYFEPSKVPAWIDIEFLPKTSAPDS